MSDFLGWAEKIVQGNDKKRAVTVNFDRLCDAYEEIKQLRAENAEIPCCSVCLGEGKLSGDRPCICAGYGTEAGEIVGLRNMIYSQRADNEQLRAENERLKRMAYVLAARLAQSDLVIDDETLAARNECLNYHGATSNE